MIIKMSLKKFPIIALICFGAVCVQSLTEPRNGATLVQEKTDVSIGYMQWKMLSVLRSKLLLQSFQRAEQLKNKLFHSFKTNKKKRKYYVNTITREASAPYKDNQEELLAEAEDYDSEQQFNHMNQMSEIAREKLQELDVYLGNQKRIEKRQFGGAASSVGSLFYKIAADLFGFQTEKEYERRMKEFVATFQPEFDSYNNTVQDIITYNDKQVTYNKRALNEILSLEEKYEFLEGEISELAVDVESRIKIQFMIAFLKQTYQDLIDVQQRILQGLIEAAKGNPSAPFFSPSKLLNVLLSYQELGHLEKSIFGREDILQLYDLTSTTVTKVGEEVAVLSSIKIPTSSTTGRLFRIVPFPVFQSEKNKYVTIRPQHKYIAVNGQSKYLLLNDEDLNACSHSKTMILCESGEMVWKNRNDPTCEGAIWFQDEHLTQTLCDYDIEEATEPKLVYIHQGIYHYSMPREWSVPFECTGDFHTSENVPLEHNGFIHLSTRCVASVQSHLLKNLFTNKVKTFTTTNDNSDHDIDEITEAKRVAAKAKTELLKEQISLKNADIIEAIEHNQAIDAKEDEIADLFQKVEEDLGLGLTEEEKEEIEGKLKKHEEEAEEEKSNMETTIFLTTFVGIMVLALIVIMVYVYLCIVKRVQINSSAA